MGFVANFILFRTVQTFENRLRFDKVTEILKVGTFLRYSVYTAQCDNQTVCHSLPLVESHRRYL